MIHLYHCASSRSIRPLWALEECGVPYELTILPFPPRNVPEFLEVNPRGTIPWMNVGKFSMDESVAMIQYIANTSATNGLALSVEDEEYGAWLNWITFGEASLTYPLSLVIHYSEIYAQFVPDSPVIPEVKEYYLNSFMEAINLVNIALAKSEYLVADRFTAADISVGYNFTLCEMLGILDQLPPRVLDYCNRLQSRPSFQKVMSIG